MNGDASKVLASREAELERLGGPEAFARHSLSNLRLKTVIKESHGEPVQALAFNHADPALGNVFATVGADQATIYDDEHMGGHVSIVVHFTNAPSAHAPGGPLSAAAWLPAGSWAGQPDGDAMLAVAGGDANISIISMVEARVTRLLHGHAKEVLELSACAGRPRLLASLSRDGNLRLWDVPSEASLASLQCDATSIALAPDGSCLLTGNAKGKLHRYDLSPAQQPAVDGQVASGSGSSTQQQQQQQQQQPESCWIEEVSRAEVQQPGSSSHCDCIDCISFLPGGRLATKSTDGRMVVWRLPGSSDGSDQQQQPADGQQAQQGQQQQDGQQPVAQQLAAGALESVASWKVPSCGGGSGISARSSFGSTPDGRFIAVGNSKGDCFVFDACSSERLAHVSAARISAPVRAVALSADGRHLLAAVGRGFVFRFEYPGGVPPREEGAAAAAAAAGEAAENGGGLDEQQQEEPAAMESDARDLTRGP